nr:proline-rich receptor-like protein kinase PERK8 [Ipomoea batatas]
MEYKKEKEKRTERRSSRRLAEQARQGMLKARKAAHGGHEVGDTSMDPLVLTLEDEEMETPPPAMERVPKNREYHQNDADYVLFLLKQSENEGPRNTSSPNSSAAPTQESSYSPPGYAPLPPSAKSKASKGTASSSRKK